MLALPRVSLVRGRGSKFTFTFTIEMGRPMAAASDGGLHGC